MAKLIWSPTALTDLAALADYIGRDSEHYARLFVQRIVSAVETLASFPEAGRIVPEYGRRDLRELLFHNYRIVYRIKQNEVQVVAIVHGARLLPDVEQEE
ncbi:MAG: type II toxin-antitoxin system RelE/ParE family toxin [candidate division WOR-3 bacterium]